MAMAVDEDVVFAIAVNNNWSTSVLRCSFMLKP